MPIKRTRLFVLGILVFVTASWEISITQTQPLCELTLLALGQLRISFHPAEAYAVNGNGLTAVWANDGGDKVTRDELRASLDSASVENKIWDGTTIKIFGAKNEVVAFNLVLESASTGTNGVSVPFDALTGPGGFSIASEPTSGNGLFDWTNRNIELFYVRYLQIKGLSKLSYATYDERHIPQRCRLPYKEYFEGQGTWEDRPCHDKYYLDIAVPLQLEPSFDITAGENQSIWVGIYIPRTAPAGLCEGTVIVSAGGIASHHIPVRLMVRDFLLPDMPNAKTMVVLTHENINQRFLGNSYPEPGTPEHEESIQIVNRHFLTAHRHRISLIGDEYHELDQPRPDWVPRLNGSLFTASNGYDGPGVNVGNNVYSIGTYGSWDWQNEGATSMRQHTDAWVEWFDVHSPDTEYFLYLIDESQEYPLIEKWARWINDNPGLGARLMSMATIDMPTACPDF
jgi:hypothetical protein